MASSEAQEKARRGASKSDERRDSVDDYLERTGLAPLLREGLSAVLQSRPDDPVQFLYDYYFDLMRGGGAQSKAIRLLRRTRPNSSNFGDIIYATYNILSTKKSSTVTQTGATGQPSGPARALAGEEYLKFMRVLLADVPSDLSELLMSKVIVAKDAEIVEFSVFRSGVTFACVVADMFADINDLVKEIGPDESGRIGGDNAVEAVPFFIERHAASIKIHRPPLQMLLGGRTGDIPPLLSPTDYFHLLCTKLLAGLSE